MIYLVNAFSLGMFLGVSTICIKIEELTPENARKLLEQGFESYIGHESTAVMLESLLNINIPVNRKMLSLGKGQHEMLVVQLGIRLPENVVLPKDELLELYSLGRLKLLHLHVKAE